MKSHRKRHLIFSAASLTAAFVMIACGGSGGGSGPTTATTDATTDGGGLGSPVNYSASYLDTNVVFQDGDGAWVPATPSGTNSYQARVKDPQGRYAFATLASKTVYVYRTTVAEQTTVYHSAPPREGDILQVEGKNIPDGVRIQYGTRTYSASFGSNGHHSLGSALPPTSFDALFSTIATDLSTTKYRVMRGVPSPLSAPLVVDLNDGNWLDCEPVALLTPVSSPSFVSISPIFCTSDGANIPIRGAKTGESTLTFYAPPKALLQPNDRFLVNFSKSDPLGPGKSVTTSQAMVSASLESPSDFPHLLTAATGRTVDFTKGLYEFDFSASQTPTRYQLELSAPKNAISSIRLSESAGWHGTAGSTLRTPDISLMPGFPKIKAGVTSAFLQLKFGPDLKGTEPIGTTSSASSRQFDVN